MRLRASCAGILRLLAVKVKRQGNNSATAPITAFSFGNRAEQRKLVLRASNGSSSSGFAGIERLSSQSTSEEHGMYRFGLVAVGTFILLADVIGVIATRGAEPVKPGFAGSSR